MNVGAFFTGDPRTWLEERIKNELERNDASGTEDAPTAILVLELAEKIAHDAQFSSHNARIDQLEIFRGLPAPWNEHEWGRGVKDQTRGPVIAQKLRLHKG